MTSLAAPPTTTSMATSSWTNHVVGLDARARLQSAVLMLPPTPLLLLTSRRSAARKGRERADQAKRQRALEAREGPSGGQPPAISERLAKHRLRRKQAQLAPRQSRLTRHRRRLLSRPDPRSESHRPVLLPRDFPSREPPGMNPLNSISCTLADRK